MGIVDGHPRRPFVPHVTLASRLHDEVVASALASLSKYRVNTVIERLSLLEQRYEDATRRWDVVGAIEFGGIALRGRGGRELTFQVASQLDPNDAEWVKDAWEAYRKFTYGKDVSPDQSYAITARHQGSIVGCATGVLRGQICELGVLIVDAAHRNEGIGAQLLKEVEYLARVKGASRMLLRTLCAGSAVGFYEARGYRRVAILPTWREGRDFAVLERIL
jgi:GNAT superfamily N-acetyltransferase